MRTLTLSTRRLLAAVLAALVWTSFLGLHPAAAAVLPALSINDVTQAEGNEGTSTFTFTIALDAPAVTTVFVDYTTENGTATAVNPLDLDPAVGSGDYVRRNGTAIFNAGETTKTVTVTVNGDEIDEGASENFVVNLYNATGATVADAQGVGTIIDDDPTPTLTVSDATPNPVPEATAALNKARFTVTLSGASAQTITVNHATANGTATAGQDYTSASGSLTFNPGDTSKSVDVTVLDDAVYEPGANQTFTLNLSSPSNATVADGSGTAAIQDNESAPSVTVNDVSVSEGAGTATFTVTASRTSDSPISFTYATGNDAGADAPATAGTDYTATSGTGTITAGNTTTTFSVPVTDDAVDEPDETYAVTVTYNGNSDGGTGTIVDNDAGVAISVNDITVAETANGVFTVSLSAISAQTVTVNYVTEPGTATAGADYTPAAGQVSFGPGETSKTVTVNTINDATPEPTETYSLVLSSPSNATIADGRGVATIISDDGAPPTLSISDVTVTEGAAGTTATARFTVTLSPNSGFPVTVGYRTSNGTATAPSDYQSDVGTISFASGETSKTIDVTINGDAADEADETFSVLLQNASNATVGDGEGIGTITDDDATPTISIADASANEGNLLTSNATFTVTLSAASGKTVTVSYATADGTATAGSDYTAVSGSLQFDPGETTKTISVPIVGDTTDEPNETFLVNLSAASNATLADGSATGTIVDDDARPGLSVNDPSAVTEGAAGSTKTVDFVVNLSAASSQAVNVDYTTAPGTATSPSDFVATSGTLTFTAGQTSKTVSVTINGDDVDEPNETFQLRLSNAQNATITDGTGSATITDDDGTPSLSVDDPEVTEPDAGTTNLVFTVSLLPAAATTVTVNYATADGTATAGSDYTATSGVLTFTAGQTSKTVSVTITGDTTFESNELLLLRLSNATGATIGDSDGIGTIRDNDGGSDFVVSDAQVGEGNAGLGVATFVVERSGAITSSASVTYATADGTATAGSDYSATNGTLTFGPSETRKTVDVIVNGDTRDEPDETFTFDLTAGTNARLADGSGTGTITDDDGAPSLSVNDVVVSESAGNATFTITLSSASGNTVTVAYATANGSASAGDYTARSGTATFAPGTTSTTVAVPIVQDSAVEGTETFTLGLSSPSNASIADGTGVATITDDDTASGGGSGGGGSGGGGGSASSQGYSLVGADGSLYAFGTAKNFGDMKGKALTKPIIGVAYTPGGNGYWLVAEDGGIFSFGDADFYGSMGAQKINSPVIGMAATPSGKGYWLFSGDGGIFSFGDATFFGSMGDQKLNAPVINMEPLASGNGYWLVAADGGIFSFGKAEFQGSMGDQKINQPVFDMTSTDTDQGYWLVARDGGVFSFGDAGPKFYGNPVSESNPKPTKIIGMDSTPSSLGYWIADATGKVWNYGDAQPLGDRYGANNPASMIGFASVPK